MTVAFKARLLQNVCFAAAFVFTKIISACLSIFLQIPLRNAVFVGMEVLNLVCNTVGVPCMFTSFFSRTNGLAGGEQPFRLSPRRTPPLFRLPIAHKLFWSFFFVTAPAFSRLHRLHSRLTARLPAARADFLQRVRRLLTGGSLCPACALGGNRLA